MLPPPIPENEAARLQALLDSELLDSPPEPRFDRLTRLAQRMFHTDMALVSLVDAERQWFKSRQGIEVCQTSREISFCGHAILTSEILYIPDATLDPRFADNPLVLNAPYIRFYAGAPLCSSHGFNLGTLCLIDAQPRCLTSEQLAALRDLADCVEAEMNQTELRQQKHALRQAQRLGEVISRVQASFIRELDRRRAFDGLLTDILSLTVSEYGFIGEILHKSDGQAYLKTYAISNIAWNESTRAFYELNAPKGMEFFNSQSLFGVVFATGQVVIANDPAHDLRRAGLPDGHPVLQAFLGVPIFHNHILVAMLGLANRPEGYQSELVEFLQPLLATIGQLVDVLKIQRQHQEREERYKLTLNSAELAAWDWDIATGRVEFNERWALMRGYQPQDSETDVRSWQQGIHPDDMPLLNRLLEEHFAGYSDLFEVEYRVRTRIGQWIWILARGAVTRRDENGVPLRMVGTELDISRQKHAVHALKRSENRFRALAEHLPVGIFEADAKGNWTFVNETWCRLSGLVVSQSTGLGWVSALDAGVADLVFAEWLAAVKNKEVFRMDFPLRKTSTEVCWVSVHALPLQDELSNLLGYSGSVMDITERKLGMQALSESEHRYRALAHGISALIWTSDTNKQANFFNDSWLNFTGRTLEQELGLGWTDGLHPEDRERFLGQYQAAFEQRQPLSTEFRLWHATDDYHWVRADAAPAYDSLGNFQGYVAACIDVNQQKCLDQLKTEFISTVSHELRTPLTSISGALGLITSGALGNLPDKVSQLVAIAHNNSLRLSYLINDLLDMEKLVAGKMHFELKQQSLMPVVEQALEDNRSCGLAREVSLILTHSEPEIKVQVDEQRLLQVLSNLLSNAIKFSPEQSQVEVAVTKMATQVRVAVHDRGPGIPMAFRERIFQKFAQADSSDQRQKGGTGLGLAITRELIERMHGQIGFESVEGQGACFFIDIPLVAPSPQLLPATVVEPLPVLSGPRILVVEDDPDVAQLLSVILTAAGYQHDVAMTGAQAVTALQHKQYDAVTLDLMLPDMSGLDFIHQVRLAERTAELPIIVVSAYMEAGQLAICGDFLGIDWLAKPINAQHLLSIIQRQLPTSPNRQRILHVEDDPELRQVIGVMLSSYFELEFAASLAEARSRLQQSPAFDILMLDLSLTDGSGWELVAEIRHSSPSTRILVLSGSDLAPRDKPRVEAALLKSRVSPAQLLQSLTGLLKPSTAV